MTAWWITPTTDLTAATPPLLSTSELSYLLHLLSLTDKRLYSPCQLCLSFYRVISRHTHSCTPPAHTHANMWIHSAPTQGSDWHTHMQRNPLLHQISLPSYEKKRQATPAFRQKLLSYSNKHKAAIDKKKMSSLRACKKKKYLTLISAPPLRRTGLGGGMNSFPFPGTLQTVPLFPLPDHVR